MTASLLDSFPLPGRDLPWGTTVDHLGSAGARQVQFEGTVACQGLSWHRPVVVSGSRGIVSVVTYALTSRPTLDPLRERLGAGEVRLVPNRGLASQVAQTWTWDLGRQVTLAVSIFAAPREANVAGVYLSCGEERLGRPFVAELAEGAPWRRPGSVEPLDVPGLVPRALGEAVAALRHPGLRLAPDWALVGLWTSAGWWGIADGRYTCAFPIGAPCRLTHQRTLPARGPGGARLVGNGLLLLTSEEPHGLDALVERLRARAGAVVVLEEDRDC